MFHIERSVYSKPRKTSLAQALANHPELLAMIEAERDADKRSWELETANGLRDAGLPIDIATVASRRSRLASRAELKAYQIAELLNDLQTVNTAQAIDPGRVW